MRTKKFYLLFPVVVLALILIFVGCTRIVESEGGQTILPEEIFFDFGDAPNPPYPTLLVSNGARHIIVTGIFLGARIDAEDDGQPNTSASGDDAAGNDDEDGITFGTLEVGTTANVTVNASISGWLNAWLDFNDDGDWADAGERIFADLAINTGDNALQFAVPPAGQSVTGNTYARFRFTGGNNPNNNLSFTGEWDNGEVEDYRISINEAAPPEFDFGDADDDYPVLLPNGARHIIVQGIHLGALIDAEEDGQPLPDADGDDLLDGNDDEDGVTFNNFVVGTTGTFTVNASTIGTLNAWIDFNDDGDWGTAGDQIFIDQPLVSGDNVLTFNIPASTPIGRKYARFRFSTASGLSFSGLAPDGEVEDYSIIIGTILPLPSSIGDFVWFDDNRSGIQDSNVGIPEPGAAGITVHLFDSISINPIATTTTDVSGNYQFTGLFPGTYLIQVIPPSTHQITAKDVGSDDTIDSDCDPSTGLSDIIVLGSGENITSVDCGLLLKAVATDDLDFGDAPDPAYPTLLASDGARHIISQNVFLGTLIDSEFDGQPSPGADGDDNNNLDDEDGVTFGSLVINSTANITVFSSIPGFLNAWLDFNADGTWSLDEQIFTDEPLHTNGANLLEFPIPVSINGKLTIIGNTYVRFRFTSFNTVGSLQPNGQAADGEVEDYRINLDAPAGQLFDFGDAPDHANFPEYPTLLINNGARHAIVPGVFLGVTIDAELDGQPNPPALKDDNTGLLDDEDGVILNPIPAFLDTTMNFQITASVAGFLNAWIDINDDGDWNDPGEQVFTDEPLSQGVNNKSAPNVISDNPKYARFKFTPFNTFGFLKPTGNVNSGEVEDYLLSL